MDKTIIQIEVVHPKRISSDDVIELINIMLDIGYNDAVETDKEFISLEKKDAKKVLSLVFKEIKII